MCHTAGVKQPLPQLSPSESGTPCPLASDAVTKNAASLEETTAGTDGTASGTSDGTAEIAETAAAAVDATETTRTTAEATSSAHAVVTDAT